MEEQLVYIQKAGRSVLSFPTTIIRSMVYTVVIKRIKKYRSKRSV